MKIVKWAVAGATTYVIYRYQIGRKSRGDEVLRRPPEHENSSPEKRPKP